MLFVKDVVEESTYKIWETLNYVTRARILEHALKKNPDLEVWVPLVYYKLTNDESNAIVDDSIYISNRGLLVAMKGRKSITVRESGRGYPEFTICVGNQSVKVSIHRAVGCCFVGRPVELDDKPLSQLQINHKDGDKTNPDSTNLEWTTGQGNIQHAYDTGLKEASRGASNSKTRPVIATVTKEGPFKGVTFTIYGKRELVLLGFSKFGIWECCNGKRATSRGCKWEYYEGTDQNPPSKELLEYLFK